MPYLEGSDPARSLTDYYPSWLDSLADDVTIEGSAMDGVAQGAEAVRTILVAICTLYESQQFNFVGPVGDLELHVDGPGFGHLSRGAAACVGAGHADLHLS